MKCPSCAFDVPDAMNFCGNCGASLAAGAARVVSPAKKSSQSDRRPLTIMFCDLVGSTGMSEVLDPEELQELLGQYQKVCGNVIEQYDGHVAQYLGDGILVYFGYPHAHEDDARRAVLAGLNIIEAMAELNRELGRETDRLQVRIGIHTGLVVTGAIGQGTTESLALGQAPNIAARIQGMASPDTVAISLATRRLTERHFEFESLGAPALKGVSQVVEVYQVLHETGTKTGLQAIAERGLSKAVGREAQLGQMCDCWDLVRQHSRQAVTISGEAGIGKSRLVSMFHELAPREAATWLIARCSAYTEHTAFAAIIDLLENHFKFDRLDSAADKLSKLQAGIGNLNLELATHIPVLCDILDLPVSDEYQPVAVAPDQRKQQAITAVNSLLVRIAERQPVVVLFEDVHWADSSTLDFLSQTLCDKSRADIFCLITYRSSFTPPWDPNFAGSAIELQRLTDADVGELIESITAPRAMSTEVIELIARRTDGIPLFAEELTKMLIESDQLEVVSDQLEPRGSLQDLAVPTTLHSSLVARLDRLGSAKDCAQLGAVLGREFSFDMLASVCPYTKTTLQEHLDELEDAGVLAREREGDEAIYSFRHALIRDAAYDTLLKKDRARHHQIVAETLVEKFPDICDTRPEIVANHFTRAGVLDVAVDYWQRAGGRAAERFANAEAIAHFAKGIELIAKLPESTELRCREINMQTSYGGAISIHDGWQAEAAGDAFERAFELCQGLPETAELFWVLWQLAAHYATRDILKTEDIGRQLIKMAEAEKAPELLVEAQFCTGAALLFTGRLTEANEILASAQQQFESAVDPTKMSPTGQNPAVNITIYLGMVEFLVGNTKRGLLHARNGLDLALQHTGPPHQAGALCWQGFITAMMGDAEATLAYAEKALPLSAGVYVARQWAGMLHGWALCRLGRGDEGITQMQDAADAYRNAGIRSMEAWILTLKADGLLACQDYSQCIDVVAEALRVAEQSDETFANAELHRILGEAQRALGATDDAKTSFRNALEIAQTQGANTLVLKASRSYEQLLEQLA